MTEVVPTESGGSVEQTAAAVDALRDRIAQLQQTVERLVERQAGANVDRGSASGVPRDPEVVVASHTLRAAQATADEVIVEARMEAARILADATSEADEILYRSRRLAGEQFAHERDQLTEIAAAWSTHRAAAIAELESLNDDVNRHRTRLASTKAAIDSALRELHNAPAIEEPVAFSTSESAAEVAHRTVLFAVQSPTVEPAVDDEPEIPDVG